MFRQAVVLSLRHTTHSGDESTSPSNVLPCSTNLSSDLLKVFTDNVFTVFFHFEKDIIVPKMSVLNTFRVCLIICFRDVKWSSNIWSFGFRLVTPLEFQLPHDLLVMVCLRWRMESYQNDICHFRAMTLSPLHLVVNWQDFTICKHYRATLWYR